MMYDYDISFEAAQFAQIPQQLEELEQELRQLEDEGAPAEELISWMECTNA